MFVVLRPGVLVRVLAATAFAAALLVLFLGGGGLKSGASGTPSTATPSVLASIAPTSYVVVGTSKSGLNVRSCAAATCRRVGWVGEGGTFLAECWTHGTPASGDDRWLRGTADGHTGYAAAHFLKGSGAPECGVDPARQS